MILVKKFCFPLIVTALFISIFLGYNKYSERQLLKQDLNLDGIFINVKGVEISTEETNYFESKPYKKIKIEIPSLSSQLDDQTSSNSNNKGTPNQIINREKFDKNFVDWLKSIYDEKNCKKDIQKKIEIWYRDIKVVDKEYK
ncbi:hypothetical protein [Streptococcus sanguinis]|uniref:hypothetical protein n=1 Tax=Streptococcus sanguinis TaxID=1305 RepID=UPI00020C3B6C|nr:hypothetical protein [Streptococcus sanguinis]EGJ44649.1 hypothetical protein HMPREF9396_0708 [Streptococcus sanguinis SK1059]